MIENTIKIIIEEINSSKKIISFINNKKNKYKLSLIKKETLFLNEKSSLKERIFCILNNITNLVKCEKCENIVKFNRKINSYSKLCVKCSSRNKTRLNKIKQTNIKKYGVENYSQTNEYKEKIKQTSLKKYNVEHFAKSIKVKEKIKQTNLEKYGVKNYSSSNECRKKVKQTNLEKYGVEKFTQSLIFKNKSKKTNLKKYGVENYSQKHIPQETLDKLNDKEWMYNEHIIKQKPLIQVSNELNLSPTTASRYLKKHNIEAQYFGRSVEEKELQEYISSLTSNVITNTRSVISPLELDIYLPDYQVAFEFNGLYWHSHSKLKDKFYHINKTNACKEQNIQLIHIFEHEWLFKQDIIKSKINSLLNSNKIINANKCQIKEISYDTSESFLNRTHIQENLISEIQIGLFYEDQLVSVMTFNKSKINEYALLRFGSELNIDVVGAESKLFNYFIKEYNPKSVISYNDLRYETGYIYNKIGFELNYVSDPDYFYFKGDEIKKNQNYKLLEYYEHTLTEYQNMINHGWDKIYDCGKGEWIYE